jgi:hypothetical protein
MQGTILPFGAEAEVAFCFAFKRLAGGVVCLNHSYKYGVCLPAYAPSRYAFKAAASPVDGRPVDYLHCAGVVARPPHRASHLSHAAKTDDVTPNTARPTAPRKKAKPKTQEPTKTKRTKNALDTSY